MNNGWICLHRKMLDWEWFDDKNTFRVFMVLLLNTNHSDKQWKGVLIKRGSSATGLLSLSKACGLSVQQVRTSINKLKSTNEITIESYNLFSIISITNWDSYQTINKQNNIPITNNQQTDNKQITNKQQTDNKPITTNNNDNNDNNDNNETIKESKKKRLPRKKHIFIFPDNLNRDSWEEFVEHRKLFKVKFTDLAKTKAANIIKDFTHEEQRRIIDYSIATGYPGLYANQRYEQKQYKTKTESLTPYQQVVKAQEERDNLKEKTIRDINPQPRRSIADELLGT